MASRPHRCLVGLFAGIALLGNQAGPRLARSLFECLSILRTAVIQPDKHCEIMFWRAKNPLYPTSPDDHLQPSVPEEQELSDEDLETVAGGLPRPWTPSEPKAMESASATLGRPVASITRSVV